MKNRCICGKTFENSYEKHIHKQNCNPEIKTQFNSLFSYIQHLNNKTHHSIKEINNLFKN
jgi:hypothetical protein